MAENNKAIKKTYDASLAKIQAILFSQSASSEEKKIAKQSLNDLTAAMLAHNLKTIEGRTALLSSLITELREVIDSVQTGSPIAAVAGDLTGLLGQAKKLFKDEKKALI